jgi:hypothetical protein
MPVVEAGAALETAALAPVFVELGVSCRSKRPSIVTEKTLVEELRGEGWGSIWTGAAAFNDAPTGLIVTDIK